MFIVVTRREVDIEFKASEVLRNLGFPVCYYTEKKGLPEGNCIVIARPLTSEDPVLSWRESKRSGWTGKHTRQLHLMSNKDLPQFAHGAGGSGKTGIAVRDFQVGKVDSFDVAVLQAAIATYRHLKIVPPPTLVEAAKGLTRKYQTARDLAHERELQRLGKSRRPNSYGIYYD